MPDIRRKLCAVGPFSRLSRFAILLAVSSPFASQLAWGQPRQEDRRSYDRRSLAQAAAVTPRSAQTDALTALRQELDGSLIHGLDPVTGVTRSLSNPVGYLTAPRPGDPSDIALDFVRSRATLLGLDAADLAELEVTDAVFSAATGATHVYLRQVHQGLPVFNATLQVHLNREGRISGVQNGFVPDVAAPLSSPAPAIDAAQAVSAAASHLNLPVRRQPSIASQPVGVQQKTSLVAADVSLTGIEAELMWLPVGRRLHLVWRFQIHTLDGQHIFDITVDAESGGPVSDAGRVITRFDWVSSDSYRVYRQPVESPQHTTPSPPAEARILATDPADPTASALGWHDTGSASYTVMRGNNVHAYEDSDANDSPPGSQPSCGASLNCDFPVDLSQEPSNYRSAAIANLFYWNNIIHDVQYQYGFDEAGGNFQVNNFSNGGAGGDDVRAEAQDGSGTCNANFATPTDGGRPRMQMFLCDNVSPARDGDFDNGVIVHEYGHGISVRQVGGPGNSSCLNNNQQGGEGWSDWFALVYTAEVGDAGLDARGIGTYLFGQAADGPGIRPQRYSTDPLVNSYTYESINGLSIPHGVGSVWAQVLWEMYWRLVDDHGFDPDLYDSTAGAGNHRALLYVNEGLKNTACSPTFVDARDGVIQVAVDNFSGEDVCALWEVFAAYGLGTDAVSGGSNSTSPTNGFNLPASCLTPPDPPTCPVGSIDFNAFTLEAYSNQDGTGELSIENDGDTLLIEGNRWRRSTDSFEVTTDTVIEFQFQSAAEGEIHGVGFDENQELSNDVRIFQFWGTQNWTGANQFSPRYSGSDEFETFSIRVGQFYTGSSMRLVFVNDKDAGSATNLGRFACVRVVGAANTPPSVTISSPPDNSSFMSGASVVFVGSASDTEDGVVTMNLTWNSSLDDAIGSGGSFSTTGLSLGTHTITAAVTDNGGLSGSDSIVVTINPDTGGCNDCIDWENTQTVSYSNQDRTGTVEPQEAGASLFLEGNRWRRTTQTVNVTPSTVIEFEFMSTSKGEIHGIGFDEDDTLNNNTRIFEIFGTQNWSGAFQNAQQYTSSDLGNFVSFRIKVGEFYTGSGMFLVVNDKDAGTQNNNGTFRNVRIFEELPPVCGEILLATDFEAGPSGWFHSVPDSTCSTGDWMVGNPDQVVNSGVTTQLEDDHSATGVNAFFTQPNAGGAGTDDVDGGVCTALSTSIDANAHSDVQITLWYYFGQRDQGDDAAGDFFSIDVSTDGGSTFTTNLVSIGDVTLNAEWTQVATTVANPGDLVLRVQVSDGAGPGDLVEAGLDDIVICVPQ